MMAETRKRRLELRAVKTGPAAAFYHLKDCVFLAAAGGASNLVSLKSMEEAEDKAGLKLCPHCERRLSAMASEGRLDSGHYDYSYWERYYKSRQNKRFFGIRGLQRYHTDPECPTLKLLLKGLVKPVDEELISFASAEEAFDAGYEPCNCVPEKDRYDPF